MSTHAILSPSSAVRWMSCPGSVELSKGYEDQSSMAANEGTLLHAISAECLESNRSPADFPDIDDEQRRAIQTYLDLVRDIVRSTGGELAVEQRLSIEFITGEKDAHGTADAVIVSDDELIIIDAKFGRGVEVTAERNEQLLMYAAAAYEYWSLLYRFTQIRLVICQPRLTAAPEWVCGIDELDEFTARATEAAQATHAADAPLVPSPKACQWCRAKGNCPAIREQLMADFEDVVPETADDLDLARVMTKAGMIESWVKAVRAEVERRLLAGEPVTGYKLVQGKRGNRAWGNAAEAEELLKSMRIKHDMMYDYSLASPTTVEKLAKAGEIGPRQWTKIKDLITQTEGRPSVAPISDKRDALVTQALSSDFDDVTDL
jgi:hypothetical protein